MAGALHILPIAVKSLGLTKGLRRTFGFPVFIGFVLNMNPVIVERMRAAGAIIVGKTNVSEGP